jgi:hypothetical protein
VLEAGRQRRLADEAIVAGDESRRDSGDVVLRHANGNPTMARVRRARTALIAPVPSYSGFVAAF